MVLAVSMLWRSIFRGQRLCLRSPMRIRFLGADGVHVCLLDI